MNIPNSEWDWKKGVSNSANIGKIKIEFNYFTCGVYFFDGKFNVVKFPKGMQLYHGSGALANANVEFPLGSDYYTPTHVSDNRIDFSKLIQNLERHPNEKVETAASEFFDISPGWFADPRIAKLYSLQNNEFAQICDDKCVSVYELAHDAVFIILDNNFNIWRLLNSPTVPEVAKNQLKVMFNLHCQHPSLDRNAFGKLYLNKQRRSFRDIDIPFSKWLCRYISKEYVGYAANVSIEQGKMYFHLEFMFCNPLRWLNRNLKNDIDWQYNTFDSADSIIKQFIEQMSFYKSTNINWHAGNLLEHSIWCLLFAEKLMLELPPKYKLPLDIQKKIAAAAFLHDIGKMAPQEAFKRKHDYIYYSIPTHPKIGSEYINGTRKLPLLDRNMKKVGVFDVSKLIHTFGFVNDSDISLLSKIVDLHWEFGPLAIKWKGDGDMVTVKKYISKVGNNETFLLFISLVIISMADILASQPYGIDNLKSSGNHTSRFFPFIKNVPKKYRGAFTNGKAKMKRNLFALSILDTVLPKDVSMKEI